MRMCRGGCHSCRARWGSCLGPAVLSAPPGLRLTFSGPSQGTPERATPPAPSLPHSQASGQIPWPCAPSSLSPAASCAQTKRALSPDGQATPLGTDCSPPLCRVAVPSPGPAPLGTRCQPCVPPSLRLTLPASASLLGLDIHS